MRESRANAHSLRPSEPREAAPLVEQADANLAGMEGLLIYVAYAAVFGGIAGGAWLWGKYRLTAWPYLSTAAQDIGLNAISPYEARGERGGISLGVIWRVEMRKAGGEKLMGYWAALDPPLRMGLSIEREAFLDPARRLIGVGADIAIGDNAFDDAFAIRAIDADQVRSMIFDQRLSSAIWHANYLGRFWASDTHVVISRNGWDRNPEKVRDCVDAVYRVAQAFLAVRQNTPGAWEADVHAAWGAISRTEDLSYDPKSTRLVGTIGNAWVQLDVTATPDGMGTSASMRFSQPLGIGLNISRAAATKALQLFFGKNKRVQSDHAAFDEMFVASAREPSVARALLQNGGAEALVKLGGSAYDVAATDEGIRLSTGTLLRDAREIGRIVEAMTHAMRAFDAGGPAQSGVYR